MTCKITDFVKTIGERVVFIRENLLKKEISQAKSDQKTLKVDNEDSAGIISFLPKLKQQKTVCFDDINIKT